MSLPPYDAIAEWYDRILRENPIYEVVLGNLLDLAGEVAGQAICDLACGQGFVTRELARRGAVTTGVDISTKLLALARGYEASEPLGIRYVEDDAQTLAKLPDAAFDGVTCSMALMNIPDLAACFRAARRVLRPVGWFVWCITHPCFQAPHASWLELPDGRVARLVTDYLDEREWRSDNPAGMRGRIAEAHRTLSTYLNTL
ncbi:MAG TPA: class I SAM-dependent methyltransferase, partial [Thermomicrobiaceae bacterium]|nr:class I SAM-dependent methyltransferase [Thermomicrobiaceae bacterium]